MGFFSRFFGKDTIKMVDVKEGQLCEESETDRKDEFKQNVDNDRNVTEKSPFLDDGDGDRPF